MKRLKKKLSYTLYFVLCLVFLSCKNKTNVKDTIKWIETAEKPITVKLHTINGLTMENRYTLIDNKGNIYSTGRVELSLPDVLK